jgi:hypothetical protein
MPWSGVPSEAGPWGRGRFCNLEAAPGCSRACGRSLPPESADPKAC